MVTAARHGKIGLKMRMTNVFFFIWKRIRMTNVGEKIRSSSHCLIEKRCN